MKTCQARRIISVGGGKGGVGKSIVASNLALAMAQAGLRVIIVDADLGAANQHTLFGIDKPGPTLQGLFTKEIESLEDAILPTCEPRLGIVPGSGAVVGAANINFQQKQKLIRQIRDLDTDVVVIDVGAGTSFNVLDLFDAADLRVIVMTPQLTSVQNAYSFIKGAVFREIRRLAETPQQIALVDESPEAVESNRRVPDLLARVRERDPAFAKVLLAGLANFGARVIGNNLTQPSDVGVMQAISRMTSDFLCIDAPVMGGILSSKAINDSVGRRRPFLLEPGYGDRSAAVLRGMARVLSTTDIAALRKAREDLEGCETLPTKLSDEQLPKELNQFRNVAERFAIRCKATIIYSARSIPVEFRDVSESGAGLIPERPLPVNAKATLILGCLPNKPSISCVVRRASTEEKFVGVEFTADLKLRKRIVTDLVQEFRVAEPSSPVT